MFIDSMIDRCVCVCVCACMCMHSWRQREQEQEHVREGARQKLLPFVTQLQKSYGITFTTFYLAEAVTKVHPSSKARNMDATILKRLVNVTL